LRLKKFKNLKLWLTQLIKTYAQLVVHVRENVLLTLFQKVQYIQLMLMNALIVVHVQMFVRLKQLARYSQENKLLKAPEMGLFYLALLK
jgi:hypothetical protein